MPMAAILTFLIRMLEACFAIGVIGSAAVLILTTIEDAQELFSREKKISE
jgi:hypothetical protein